jgi:hypothetical protein
MTEVNEFKFGDTIITQKGNIYDVAPCSDGMLLSQLHNLINFNQGSCEQIAQRIYRLEQLNVLFNKSEQSNSRHILKVDIGKTVNSILNMIEVILQGVSIFNNDIIQWFKQRLTIDFNSVSSKAKETKILATNGDNVMVLLIKIEIDNIAFSFIVNSDKCNFRDFTSLCHVRRDILSSQPACDYLMKYLNKSDYFKDNDKSLDKRIAIRNEMNRLILSECG